MSHAANKCVHEIQPPTQRQDQGQDGTPWHHRTETVERGHDWLHQPLVSCCNLVIGNGRQLANRQPQLRTRRGNRITNKNSLTRRRQSSRGNNHAGTRRRHQHAPKKQVSVNPKDQKHGARQQSNIQINSSGNRLVVDESNQKRTHHSRQETSRPAKLQLRHHCQQQKIQAIKTQQTKCQKCKKQRTFRCRFQKITSGEEKKGKHQTERGQC